MRKLLSVIVSLMTAMTFAQQPVELPLWPDGAPNSNGLTGGEKEVSPHRISNVTDPTITVYRAPQPNGMAVIMCPGGGYSRLAMDHEGHDMAPWFCGQGITYVVLKYRMPNGHCEVPLSGCGKSDSHRTRACRRMEYPSPQNRNHGSIRRRTSRLYPCHPFTVRHRVPTFRFCFIRWSP